MWRNYSSLGQSFNYIHHLDGHFVKSQRLSVLTTVLSESCHLIAGLSWIFTGFERYYSSGIKQVLSAEQAEERIKENPSPLKTCVGVTFVNTFLLVSMQCFCPLTWLHCNTKRRSFIATQNVRMIKLRIGEMKVYRIQTIQYFCENLNIVRCHVLAKDVASWQWKHVRVWSKHLTNEDDYIISWCGIET